MSRCSCGGAICPVAGLTRSPLGVFVGSTGGAAETGLTAEVDVGRPGPEPRRRWKRRLYLSSGEDGGAAEAVAEEEEVSDMD
jgi:hypothetical protein